MRNLYILRRSCSCLRRPRKKTGQSLERRTERGLGSLCHFSPFAGRSVIRICRRASKKVLRKRISFPHALPLGKTRHRSILPAAYRGRTGGIWRRGPRSWNSKSCSKAYRCGTHEKRPRSREESRGKCNKTKNTSQKEIATRCQLAPEWWLG